MEVACTLVCPEANKEVVTQLDGVETQKCEKCEGGCPQGEVLMCFCLCFLHRLIQ